MAEMTEDQQLVANELQAHLRYRRAAAKLLLAASGLAEAAHELYVTARAWDPEDKKDDAGVLALAESIEHFLMGAALVPSVRESMRTVVAFADQRAEALAQASAAEQAPPAREVS